MPYLWLFDIDGTLINVASNSETDPHLKAYKTDYQQILGLAVPDKVITDTYGMTEREMHTDICGKLGCSCNQQLIDQLVAVHHNNLLSELEKVSAIPPLPGIVPFLRHLKNNQEYLGIVTGNLEPTAKKLLEKASLAKYFGLVSCDDGRSSRQEVVQRAIDLAKQVHYSFDKVVVVGDRVKDITAGRAVGALTVAVATGNVNLSELGKERPTVLTENLVKYQGVYSLIKQAKIQTKGG